jgi:hypothetical protein
MAQSTINTKKKLTAELFPPEGDSQLGFKIFEILLKILEYKSTLGLPAKWNRNYELGKNKHWRSTSKKATLVSVNMLHTHRQRTTNMLTDNNPTFNVKQVGEVGADIDVDDLFDSLLRTAEFWWGDQEQQAILEKSIINGETYGCTIEKSVFNPDLEYGIGEVETELIDPFHFGIWPLKCMDVQKAEAVLHFWPMSVREARRRWPKKAEEIQADMEFLKELGDERVKVQATGKAGGMTKGYFSTFAGIIKNVLNIAGESSSDIDDQVVVVEAWVKDMTRIQQDGKEFDMYFGNIRCIQTCTAGKVILSDRNNPSINPQLPAEQAAKTYLFDKFPFSLTHSITDTVNPWGMGDFEQLEGLNIELDKTISQFTLIKDKVSRIKIINPQGSGVDNKEFTNEPGIINPQMTVASAIRYMEPPQIPADLIKALEIYKDFFMLVAGSFDLDQAQTPGRNVIAYKAIAALLERASTMLKGKIRNYTKMIRQRGRMYLSHVMNWYTEDRYISFEREGVEVVKKIVGVKMIVPAKLSVVSGSTMPVSRIQEREEAITLFQQGAIDNEALLEKLDWSDRKRMIQRMKLGPIGVFLQRLGSIGAPQGILQVLQQIAELDDKEFDRHLQKGEIPPFEALLPAPGSQEEQQPSPEQIDAEIKMNESQAKIQELQANVTLIEEKVNTERVNQAVAMAGVEFDKEKLAIERARLVDEMDRADKELETASKDKKGQGPHREKGLKSNNKEVTGR